MDDDQRSVAVVAAAAVLSAMVCTTVAGIKNRNWLGWYLAGVLLPIVSVICICLLPRLDHFGRHVR